MSRATWRCSGGAASAALGLHSQRQRLRSTASASLHANTHALSGTGVAGCTASATGCAEARPPAPAHVHGRCQALGSRAEQPTPQVAGTASANLRACACALCQALGSCVAPSSSQRHRLRSGASARLHACARALSGTGSPWGFRHCMCRHVGGSVTKRLGCIASAARCAAPQSPATAWLCKQCAGTPVSLGMPAMQAPGLECPTQDDYKEFHMA